MHTPSSSNFLSSLLGVCATVFLAAFSGPTFATSVQDVQPQGMIDSGRQVLVRFDGDMAALGRADAPAPVTVKCSPSIQFPASGRWVNTREWAMAMPQSVAPGVQCQITLTEGLKDLAGIAVRAEVRNWSFNTGSVRIIRSWPIVNGEISEQQVFLLAFNAPVTAAGLKEFISCQTQGGVRTVAQIVDAASFRRAWAQNFGDTETAPAQFSNTSASLGNRPTVGVRCASSLPTNAEVRLSLQRGIGLNGVVHPTDQTLSFRVRSAFEAKLICLTQAGVEGCDFRQPISISFSAWVNTSLVPTLRFSDGSVQQATWTTRSWRSGETQEFRFEGPFKSFGAATLVLPAGFADDDGRLLVNAAEYPKRLLIADAPAYLGMVQAHGTLSAKQGQPYWSIAVRKLEAEVPVQVRRLNLQHPQALALASSLTALPRENGGTQFSADFLTRTNEQFERVYAPALITKSQSIKTAQGDMEFVPVPLTEPGIYVIDAESPRYKAYQAAMLKARENTTIAMWGRRAIVTVTNLNAGIRIAQQGDSLVWVTALDSGQPVANVAVSLLDCSGTVLWQGSSDAKGMAWVKTALVNKRCDQPAISVPSQNTRERLYASNTLTLVAQKDNDIVTVQAAGTSQDQIGFGASRLGHVVLDRSLFKAAEVVSMQVHFRWLNAKGFALPSQGPHAMSELTATVHDPAGQELAKLPLQLNAQGDAALRWTLPANAKLGQYLVQFTLKIATNQFHLANATFQVEEFRTPVFDAKLNVSSAWVDGAIAAPLPAVAAPIVAPPAVSTHAVSTPLGPTGFRQQIKVDASLSYLSGGSAAKERVTLRGAYQYGVQAPMPGFDFTGVVKDAVPTALSDTNLLDLTGALRKSLPAPKLASAATLNLEMQFSDPNGEVQTVAAATAVWPHETRAGLRVIGAQNNESKPQVEAVLLDASNQPLAGRTVRLKTTISAMGASDLSSGITADLCEGQTNAEGRLRCPLTLNINERNERLLITMLAPDRVDSKLAKLVEFLHQINTWTLRWQRPQNELNFVEQAPYQQGQKIRLLAEPPRLPATALISMEREGVLSAEVHQVQSAGQLVELTLQDHFAPNVRVQVRYVIPQLADGQAVSVERSRMLKIEPTSYLLKVVVTPAQAQTRIRSQLPVSVRVTDLRSGLPVATSRLTIAVVDEGLLALRPNDSWNLSGALLRERFAVVDGYWLDRNLSARLPIGPQPYHLPSEEIRAQGLVAQAPMVGALMFPPAGPTPVARAAADSESPKSAASGEAQTSPRSEFSSLLLWQTQITTDANGQATFAVPTNDSLSRFRIVVIATEGAAKFGEGFASFQTTQPLQVISGLPQQVRADDRLVQSITLRNTSTESLTVQFTAKAQLSPSAMLPLAAETRKARGLDFAQNLRLAAGENKVLSWPLNVPSQPGTLNWQFEARANLNNETTRDALNILQLVNEAVPVTTRQATLVQVERETRVPFQQPAQALPQAGGVAITLQHSLADAALAETMDWMRRYPYTCLEQQTSRYSTLDDRASWDQLMQKLPQYLSGNGLANYFPVAASSNTAGSESLTAYVLDMAHAKGWIIPATERARMLDGLLAVQAGRIESLDWAPSRYLLERQLSAQATLAIYDHKRSEQRVVTPSDLNSLPSMALIDWIRFLLSPSSAIASAGTTNEVTAQKALLLTKASNELRSRFDFQGSRLRWRNEGAEYWWWFMWSGDSVAARAASVAQQLATQSPAWREDAPRIITGLIGRQVNGRWNTTVANSWAAQALRQFAQARESVPVNGVTRAALISQPAGVDASKQSVAHQWKDTDLKLKDKSTERQSPEMLLPWPQQGAKGQIQLTHEGSGAPWATVAIKAAVRITAPIAAGLTIRRAVTAVERKTPNQWSVGDVIRVRLEMSSDANNTWVVVRDAIPSGATILGRGLGRESGLAQQGERSAGWTWPSYIERATESYRAYYRWVPQGQWTTEYTLRLNNAGEFRLPAARIEAMYAPEVFGEVPAAGLVVKP